MVKIFIDAGHGGNDPGASGHGLREKDLTLDISKRIKKYLDDNYSGHTVRLSRVGDKTLSLSQRTSMANKWGADYVLSVHINAGGGTGFESFAYNGKVYSRTLKIRNIIHNEIMKRIDVADRGKKKANFHMVREPNASAMLTENLFIDTKSDADKLKDSKFLQNVAEGHAVGLAKALNLKGGKVTSKPSKPATNHTKVTKKSNSSLGLVDWMKSKKMDSSYSNRKKLASQYGVKGYKGTEKQNITLLSKLKSGKPKIAPKKKSSNVNSGDTVTLKKSAKRFTTGEMIAGHAKGKRYQVHQTSGNKVLLKSGGSYLGWVKKSDVSGGGSKTTKSKSKMRSLKVGQTVTLKKSASRFATGQTISDHAKGKQYKIIQVKSDRVLLDSIMSWVKKSDVK